DRFNGGRNTRRGYRAGSEVIDAMTYPMLDPNQFMLAGSDEKVVKAILAEQARRPGAHPFRLRQEMAGGEAYVEEAYVYPVPAPVAATA
ncbi:MAG: hypothetical protein K2W96_28900, partial [Gemmataceae bacterium]|nr:hypothetical protein [Gemmataceae bacterium]